MSGPVFLDGETVELRTIEQEDTKFVQRTSNDPLIRVGLATATPRDREQERERLESIRETEGFLLLICVDGDRVGTIGLHPPDTVAGVAEAAYLIIPEYRNNGYAAEALDLICGYMFKERRFHKMTARAYSTNSASCRVLEKVGFQKEGTLRQESFVMGEYVDVYAYGLLANEWQRNRSSSE